MAADFSQIKDHPDFQEIVSKIVSGQTPVQITDWLKVKYPDKEQKLLHLSVKQLTTFAAKHVDVEEILRRDIQIVQSGGQLDRKIAESLVNNKTYKERLAELVDFKFDLKEEIKGLVLMCKARMEQVFDRIQENPVQFKADMTLLKYFEVLFVAMEKYDKIVNNAPDQVIQHNITLHQIDQHTAVFQEAIRETLAQLDPESALLFMEIFTEKMNKLKPAPVEAPMSTKEQLNAITLLKDQFGEANE